MRAISLAASLSVLFLSGCSFDHRKDIAYELLFQPDGFENDKAFGAAISAKFHAGTPVAELEKFSTAHQGTCSLKDHEGLICEIPTRGQFCAARLIRIQATVEAGVIMSTAFVSGGLGC